MDNVTERKSFDANQMNDESQVSPMDGNELNTHKRKQIENLDHPANLKSCEEEEKTKENSINSENECGTIRDCVQANFIHCKDGASWINNNLLCNNTRENDSSVKEAEPSTLMSSPIGNNVLSNNNHLNISSPEGVVPDRIHEEIVTSSQPSPCESYHSIEKAVESFTKTQNNSSDYNKFVSITNSSADLTVLRSDSFVVISNNNALPETESIVSSNCSLAQLKTYGSEESLSEEPSVLTQDLIKGKHRIQDFEKDSDSDSSTSSSSTSILISDSSDSDNTSDDEYENYNALAHKPPKVAGELDLCDLPPIQDLKISMPEDACVPIGKVFQIVDRLVVVQSLRDVPAYDLDTVLFVQGGQPLGRIFDVFGPVAEPYYCILFNSNEHIKGKNIKIDQTIYSAPKSKHTKYVFLAQLMKLKGSDASWEDDIEPPEIYLDYSDDEQEQRAKKKRPKNRKKKSTVSDPDEPARKRHFAYERRMNERNSQLSAVRSSQNYYRNRAQSCDSVLWTPSMPPPMPPPRPPFPKITSSPMLQNACHKAFGGPPLFDSRVPPPNVDFPMNFQPPTGNSLNLIRNPPPNFTPPSCLAPFMSPCTPGQSPRSCSQPYTFPRVSPRVHGPVNNIPGTSFPRCENPWVSPPPSFPVPNFIPGHRPSFSDSSNPWINSPPPPPRGNNNFLPTSPLWIQRPQNDPSPSHQSPFSASPNRSFPPPQPFWPTQSRPQTDALPFNNFTGVRFNPNVPPPSPNPFNH